MQTKLKMRMKLWTFFVVVSAFIGITGKVLFAEQNKQIAQRSVQGVPVVAETNTYKVSSNTDSSSMDAKKPSRVVGTSKKTQPVSIAPTPTPTTLTVSQNTTPQTSVSMPMVSSRTRTS